MVFIDVSFGSTKPPLQTKAVRNLKGLFPTAITTTDEFMQFRLQLDMFLESLDLELSTPASLRSDDADAEGYSSLNEAADDAEISLTTLLVDQYDGENVQSILSATHSSHSFLRLSKRVETYLCNIFISLMGTDLSALLSQRGDFKFNRLVRSVGSSYYLAIDSNRITAYSELVSLRWESNESIVAFNKSFHVLIGRCHQLGVMTQLMDQLMMYNDKLTRAREDNTVVLSARRLLKFDDVTNLKQLTDCVAGHVLAHSSSGVEQIDTQAFAALMQRRSELPAAILKQDAPSTSPTTSSSSTICYFCGESMSDRQAHRLSCKANDQTCSVCSRKGHLGQVCEAYRDIRKALFLQSRRRNRGVAKAALALDQSSDEMTSHTSAAAVPRALLFPSKNASHCALGLPQVNSVEMTSHTGAAAVPKALLFPTQNASHCALRTPQGAMLDVPKARLIPSQRQSSSVAGDVMASISAGSSDPYLVGLDSCSSCFIFSNPMFFESLDSDANDSIDQVSGSVQVTHQGIAAFRFYPNGKIYRFPAFYIPNATLQLLSMVSLWDLGFRPVETSNGSIGLQCPESSTPLPVVKSGNIMRLSVFPSISPQHFALNAVLQPDDSDLWHSRLMHLNYKVLHQLGLA